MRDYGTPPLVWGGDPEHAHTFGAAIAGDNRGGSGTFNGRNGRGEGYGRDAERGSFCACGAWLGSLGLEPSPELYIEHIVEVFRAVRRVLRDDGVAFINLGDSYAGSGNGQKDRRPSEASLSKRNQHARPDVNGWYTGSRYDGPSSPAYGLGAVPGYKAKDLMMMPFRVALALQADGWYLRSVIPWVKRAAMPESVVDRPSSAVEYVFLLAKSSRYFWDADAVRVPSSPHSDFGRPRPSEPMPSATGQHRYGRLGNGSVGSDSGRNRRNSDWFMESWQGLMLDEEDEPLALVVNPQPFSGAHFAVFPPRLIEPMVKASTSEKGQCPECGAAWVRDVTREVIPDGNRRDPRKASGQKGMDSSNGWGETPRASLSTTTTGWRPSCAHTSEPVPQVVLDPFAGAGTVGLVADRLGRNAVLCELSETYTPMGTARIRNDAPMFAEVIGGGESVPTEPIHDKQGALGKRTYSGFNARWDAREAAD